MVDLDTNPVGCEEVAMKNLEIEGSGKAIRLRAEASKRK